MTIFSQRVYWGGVCFNGAFNSVSVLTVVHTLKLKIGIKEHVIENYGVVSFVETPLARLRASSTRQRFQCACLSQMKKCASATFLFRMLLHAMVLTQSQALFALSIS